MPVRCIAPRVDVPIPKIGLQRARIVSGVRQREAAGVPEHVGTTRSPRMAEAIVPTVNLK